MLAAQNIIDEGMPLLPQPVHTSVKALDLDLNTRRYLATELWRLLNDPSNWQRSIRSQTPDFRILGAHEGTNQPDVITEFVKVLAWPDARIGVGMYGLYLHADKYDVGLKDLERVGLWHYWMNLLREDFQPFRVDRKGEEWRIRKNQHVSTYAAEAALYLLNLCEISHVDDSYSDAYLEEHDSSSISLTTIEAGLS